MPIKALSKLLAACCLLTAFTVSAQPYPNHVVRIILPYPPGGSMDALGRMVFDRVSQALGQQFVIDYRPGASGNIGSEIAARSAPDGHTLLLNTLPFVVNAVRHDQGFRTDFPAGDVAVCAGGASLGASENGGRVHRAGEEAVGQAQLFVGRCRH